MRLVFTLYDIFGEVNVKNLVKKFFFFFWIIEKEDKWIEKRVIYDISIIASCRIVSGPTSGNISRGHGIYFFYNYVSIFEAFDLFIQYQQTKNCKEGMKKKAL